MFSTARRLLENLGVPQPSPTFIYEDNRNCIAWSEGSVESINRAKYIDLPGREHFVLDAVKAGVLKLVPVASVDNVADLLTMPLPKAAFLTLRKRHFCFQVLDFRTVCALPSQVHLATISRVQAMVVRCGLSTRASLVGDGMVT